MKTTKYQITTPEMACFTGRKGLLLIPANIRYLFFTIIVMMALIISACSNNSTSSKFDDDPETIQDIDQHTYRVVRIGNQLWMAENLATTRFNNGDEIPEVTGNTFWRDLNSGAWSRYNHLVANDFNYGKLYNWYAVTDSRGLCPAGWKIPSDDDWKALEMHLGMSARDAGYTLGRGEDENVGGKLKSLELWFEPNNGATNEAGFNGGPGGRRLPGGEFDAVTRFGWWWSTTPYNQPEAYSRGLSYLSGEIFRNMSAKKSGFSVRCLQD